jgi:hypothetical protein
VLGSEACRLLTQFAYRAELQKRIRLRLWLSARHCSANRPRTSGKGNTPVAAYREGIL